jgi:hypothetical protein
MEELSDRVVGSLRGRSVAVPYACRRIPFEPGCYAWWVQTGAIPTVPRIKHPLGPWDLVYVGISPGRMGSGATIHSRVCGQHIGGNTGSSTFRFSLAALLFEEIHWQPHRRNRKLLLSAEDNAELRRWQAEHAALRWCVVPNPWAGGLEANVIAAMKPPLNLAENSAHPFHATMTDARARFRAAGI